MVFNRRLAAPGDDDDLVTARRHGLFHAILDDGLVHQGQHLFWLRFGGGEKSRAQSGSGKDGLANFHLHG